MKIRQTIIAVMALFIASHTHAALVERLGGLAYYDDVAQLTWLADANAAGGTMNWTDANDWAANLDVAGVTGWRLPHTLQPDASCAYQVGDVSYGSNCTGSEMGNLFYNVLDGNAGQSIALTHNANYDLFSNIQAPIYWSATEYALNTSEAWHFDTTDGAQGAYGKDDSFYAWAVQTGDVSAVPVPAAVWLFVSGLIGLIGFSRGKHHISACR